MHNPPLPPAPGSFSKQRIPHVGTVRAAHIQCMAPKKQPQTGTTQGIKANQPGLHRPSPVNPVQPFLGNRFPGVPMLHKGSSWATAPPALNGVGSPHMVSAPCIQRMKFDAQGNRVWFVGVAHDTEQQAQFATWVRQLETDRNWAMLEKIYGELNTHGKSFHTLRAASLVKRILSGRQQTVRPTDWDRLQIQHLPKDLWWKLFIDKSKHRSTDTLEVNALRFDREESPGYYNMMMNAFEQQLTNVYWNPQNMGFQDYNDYHLMVTRGALRSTNVTHTAFEKVPHKLSGTTTTFPMTRQGVEPEAGALLELIGEGVAGMEPEQIERYNQLGLNVLKARKSSLSPIVLSGITDRAQTRGLPVGISFLFDVKDNLSADMRKYALAAYYTLRKQNTGTKFLSRFERFQVRGTGQTQVTIRTDLDTERSEEAVDAIFQRYRTEVSGADRNGKLTAICKVVRALHVGHFFADANGRLNTMLLLNRLLMEQGFSPAIVSDTSFFGGSKTLQQLVAMVKTGMLEFQAEVRAAHGRPRARSVERGQPLPVVGAPLVGARARTGSF